MRKIQRTYHMTPPAFNVLKKAAKLSGVSMSQFIERAVVNQIAQDDTMPKRYMKMVRKEVRV